MRTGPGAKPVDGRNTTGPYADELSREQEAVYFQVRGRGPFTSESSHKQEMKLPLQKKYPSWFEQIWEAYPKFPKGRSLKADAFKAADAIRVEDEWDASDISELIKIIVVFKKNAPHWQETSQYGPPSLQSFMRRRLYENEAPEAWVPKRKLDRWDRANIEFENRLRAVK